MKVTKTSGEEEIFSRDKFCNSLQEAGAEEAMANKVCDVVSRKMKPGMSTSDLFRRASRYLAKQNMEVAARYNLKKGIAELGPAGFIFEQYVEVLLRTLGYTTKRNQMMKGECVTHEIDVLAKKDDCHYLIEAKYHNKNGTKTPLDVVMYADARLQDVEKKQTEKEKENNDHRMWLITNTRFTSIGVEYAKCKNMTLTSWDYPKNEGLKDLITRHALYPVTILPSVGRFEREQFAKHDMMLARDIAPYETKDLVNEFGLPEKTAKKIIREAHVLVYGEDEKKKPVWKNKNHTRKNFIKI